MHLRKLLDWKTALIYLHRWMGIVLGLVFVVWFISGVAMMYVGMPRLSVAERLGHVSPLDLSTARVSPAEAAERLIHDRELGLPVVHQEIVVGRRPVAGIRPRGMLEEIHSGDDEPLRRERRRGRYHDRPVRRPGRPASLVDGNRKALHREIAEAPRPAVEGAVREESRLLLDRAEGEDAAIHEAEARRIAQEDDLWPGEASTATPRA